MSNKFRATSAFAAAQLDGRTALDWVDGDIDADMGTFAQIVLDGETSLDQDLFKGLPTPDFVYANFGHRAPDQVHAWSSQWHGLLNVHALST